MTRVDPRTSPAAVAVVRRFATRRRWGALQIRVTRPDRTDFELTLYRPDTTEVDRAWLRLWRSWRVAGLVPAGVALTLIGTTGGGIVVGASAAAILYAVGFGVFVQHVPEAGRRVVVLHGALDRRDGFDQEVGDVTRISAWSARLDAADAAFAAGEIDARDRDAVWREAWEAVSG